MPETELEPNPLSRVELLRLAQSLGVSDADVMTRAELRAAIDEASRPEPPPIEQPTTWVSVARRLLASVVERGLNLPDAAALIRGDTKLSTPPKAPPPVATVTLARIYAAQGHLDRAIGTLEEVLESDPDHELARDLRTQLVQRREDERARARQAAQAPESAAAERELQTSHAAEPPGAEPLAARALANAAAGEPIHIPDPPDSEVVTPRTPVPPEPEVDLAAGRSAAAGSGALASEPPGEIVAPAFGIAERADRLSAARANDTTGADVLDEPPTMVGLSRPEPRMPAAPAVARREWRAPEPAARANEGSPSATEPDAEGRALAEVLAAEALAQSLGELARELDGEDWDGASDEAETVAPPPSDERSGTGPSLGEGSLAEPPSAEPWSLQPSLAERSLGAERSEPARERPAAVHAFAELSATEPHGAQPIAAQPIAASSSEPASDAAPGISNGARLPDTAQTATPDAGPPMPREPGLLLIETGATRRYVYWELGAAALPSPHWITIVTHTPAGAGAERRERQLPIHQRRGVLRLEGVPAAAVVRAKLAATPESAPPLAVAACVRAEVPASAAPEIRYSPRPKLQPVPLARRAQPLLERALPVYWDS